MHSPFLAVPLTPVHPQAGLEQNLHDDFIKATKYVQYSTARALPFSTPQQLDFYAHFKQATVGPNTLGKPSPSAMVCFGTHYGLVTDKPSFLDVKGRAKWTSWTKLGEMDKPEAMRLYCGMLSDLQPGWNGPAVQNALELGFENKYTQLVISSPKVPIGQQLAAGNAGGATGICRQC